METLKADLIPVGQKIMEIATTLMNFGNSVAKVFSGLPGPVKTIMGVLAAGVALSGPIIMFTGVLANFVGYLLKGLFAMRNLLTGTKTFGQLFTPEIIASQNAADLFSKKMLEDASAVELLNGAVLSLTRSIEAMSGAMTASSTTAFLEKAALSIPFKAPKLASGGYVPGDPSRGDAYPAMLMGGEAVIPTSVAKQYAPFINAMLNGNLPGYHEGKGPHSHSLVGAHTAANFKPGSSEYDNYIAANPSLKNYPGSLNMTPDQTAMIPSWLNIKMRSTSGGASLGEFRSGWNEGGTSQYAATGARHGLSASDMADEEVRKALQKFATQTKQRTLAIARAAGKQKINDDDLYEASKQQVEAMKKGTAAEQKVAAAMEKAANTAAQARTNIGTKAVREGLANGSFTLSGGNGETGIVRDASGTPLARVSSRSSGGTRVADAKVGMGQGWLNPSAEAKTAAQAYSNFENSFAKEVNRQAEASSPSKKTKAAAKNMSDGAVEGIKEAKPRIKAAANTAMEEALLANQSSQNVASEAENLATINSPGMASTTNNRFAKFQEKRMNLRAKITSKLPSALTGRLGGLGLGLGLQVAQQFAGPAINKLPGGSIANDAITGASFGSFLGPEGAAVGAAIGGVIGGVFGVVTSGQ